MVKRLIYNNKAYKIINEYGIKNSNNEVTFNDITIDFTEGTILDIPYKYQEIQIKQSENEKDILNGTVLFTGYLDDIKLSDFYMENEEKEMTLTLLSPLKMATRRSVSLIGTYELKTAILRIVQPLIDDGYNIKEINVPKGQITTNFILETVENCMNNIGFKKNIFWNIDENKDIYINSIDYLFGLQPVKIIKQKDKEKGLLKIQPQIQSVDYANVINFKNIRLIYSTTDNNQYPIMAKKQIKKGDIVQFDFPVIVDENTLRNIIDEELSRVYNCYNIYIILETQSGENKEYRIGINRDGETWGEFYKDENISINNDEGEEKEVVLQKDSFFTNLITGFKWNGEETVTVKEVRSDTALRYTTMKFMHSAEIEKLKGIISFSGQVEKTIDYNEKWTTFKQLIAYANNLIVQNSNIVNQVILEYDVNPNLKVGDTVDIIMPSYYVDGRFAVKDINYIYYNELDEKWQITLKKSDLVSTYIDIFRPTEKEENESKIDTVILSEFIEEQIKEVHNIETIKTEHTLNFGLEV